MKQVKRILIIVTGILCFGACSDGKISKKVLNETIKQLTYLGGEGFTTTPFPIKEFTLIGNRPQLRDSRKFLIPPEITIEQLQELEKKGVLTLEIKQQEGKKSQVCVELTPKGEKLLDSDQTLDMGGITLVQVKTYSVKPGKITKIEYFEEYGKGTCYYSILYNEVTPFGEILKGAKPGKVQMDDKMDLRKNKQGEWETYTILDYMAK